MAKVGRASGRIGEGPAKAIGILQGQFFGRVRGHAAVGVEKMEAVAVALEDHRTAGALEGGDEPPGPFRFVSWMGKGLPGLTIEKCRGASRRVPSTPHAAEGIRIGGAQNPNDHCRHNRAVVIQFAPWLEDRTAIVSRRRKDRCGPPTRRLRC